MKEPKAKDKMYNFFNVSFAVPVGGVTQFVSEIVKSEHAHMTGQYIINLKAALKLPPQSVLLAVSLLGYMTEDEFNPNAPNGMEATEEYLAGLLAGQSGEHAENPYQINTKAFLDWRNGRIKGEELRAAKNQTPSK